MDIEKIKEQFNTIANEYDDKRRYIIPCFDDFYKRSVSLLKFYKNDVKSVVDLGAGTGLLTKEIYEMYNNAHFTLIDVAVDMLNIAKQRFRGLNNFEFIEHNYIENIPIKNCELMCSALSIHHLESDEKAKLYKNIYDILDKNGCFINLDIFIAGSKRIDNLYNDWWFNFIDQNIKNVEEKNRMVESRKLDKENTIQETLELLKMCGFNDIECIYNFMKFGVIMAIK
jgi:ubiquinone/menaquinone biosynthesis C-methylase UbiE